MRMKEYGSSVAEKLGFIYMAVKRLPKPETGFLFLIRQLETLCFGVILWRSQLTVRKTTQKRYTIMMRYHYFAYAGHFD